MLVFTHTPMCVSTVSQYFPESCEKISQARYSGEIRTHDTLAIFNFFFTGLGMY